MYSLTDREAETLQSVLKQIKSESLKEVQRRRRIFNMASKAQVIMNNAARRKRKEETQTLF